MSQTARHRFLSWMKPETDESLLQRYLGRQDEAAFGILVKRYINLVSSVCRKELPSAVDVEDACQATFLILAQRAGSIRQQDSLRSWLHGVALRVSKAMRRRAIRMERREREQAVTTAIASPAELLADADTQAVIRSEVECLPEQYRLPLQLCYWHGQSRDEMADTLGWTRGQVKGQLERAKKRLKARLDQRGIHFLLPLGLGLTTIGLATVLPAMVVAASTTASQGGVLMYYGGLLMRVFQATKGLAALGFLAITMGFAPPIPFIPIVFQEEPVPKQVESEDEPEGEEWVCYPE